MTADICGVTDLPVAWEAVVPCESYMTFCQLLRLTAAGQSIAELVNAAAAISDYGCKMMRLAHLFYLADQDDAAREFQRKAIALRQLYSVDRASLEEAVPPWRLLVIQKEGFFQDNTPFDFLLEQAGVVIDVLYVTPGIALPVVNDLPAYDAIFIGIIQYAGTAGLFEHINPLIAHEKYQGRVYNRAAVNFGLERDHLSLLLQGIPSVIVPRTTAIERSSLQALASGAVQNLRQDELPALPWIVRPLSSHAGKGLEKITSLASIDAYLAHVPDSLFYLAPYIDYAGADGLFRKYRLVLIAGKFWMCHLAIGEDWIVHYKSARMDESAEKRAEEARCFADFEQDFCVRHASALQEIGQRLGLDYVVLDCAETADGQLLFFEADNVSIVHAMDVAPFFAYKQAPMDKVFRAFQNMLLGL